MSFRSLSKLNPQAEEWRPATKDLQYDPKLAINGRRSQLLRRGLYPPPQTAESVVAYPADMSPYSGYFRYQSAYYYYLPPSSPLKSLPVDNGFCERLVKPFVNGDKEINDGKLDAEARTIKCPPRFRRHGGRFCFLKKSLPKLEYRRRPRKSVIPAVANSQSPPPTTDNLPSNTTVMIKNIPNQLRRDYMLNFLDHYCSKFSLEYDFLYLPMDFRRWDNLGYGFVNFTTAVAAMKFMEILQNFKWECFQTERGCFTSKKICRLTWAKIQGKEGYVRRFEHYNFACDQLEFLPVILDPPRNGSDPNPNPPVILGNLMPPRFLRKNQY